MKFSDLKGRQVILLENADKVGYISNAYLNQSGTDVTGFQVIMRGLLKGHRVFSWDDLSSIGTDAVTVAGGGALHDLDKSPLADALSTESIIGARVMSERGDNLGSVGDLDLDPASGKINEYVMAPSVVDRIEGHRQTFLPPSVKSMSAKMLVVADDAVQQAT